MKTVKITKTQSKVRQHQTLTVIEILENGIVIDEHWRGYSQSQAITQANRAQIKCDKYNKKLK